MIDWQAVMQSWDTQQTAYLPAREDRFNTMLDVLELHFGQTPFTVLDLACGPGSISGRVLARFPQARCIAADLDPVLMHLGKQTYGEHDRLTWLDVNLSHPTWSVDGESNPVEWLQTQRIHAVLTTTALHWLLPDALVRVYMQLGELQQEGDVFLNGDHMMFLPHMVTFRAISQQVRERRHQRVFEEEKKQDYATWWAAFRALLLQEDPRYYGQLLQERDQRFADRQRTFAKPIRAMHEAVLSSAGYLEVAPIWQRYDNCILLGVHGPHIQPVVY